MSKSIFGADDRGVSELVQEATARQLVVNVACWGRLDAMRELAAAYPGAQFVLDHLGMEQPDLPPPPADPFAELETVLALARYPQVAVKLTGVCACAHQPFPYRDLWVPIGRVIEAFGPTRCMCGTDWQRVSRLLSHEQATSAFRDHWPMSGDDRDAVVDDDLGAGMWGARRVKQSRALQASPPGVGTPNRSGRTPNACGRRNPHGVHAPYGDWWQRPGPSPERGSR
jgi:Amidohydrolase